jgi:hypothetical protein
MSACADIGAVGLGGLFIFRPESKAIVMGVVWNGSVRKGPRCPITLVVIIYEIKRYTASGIR